MKIYYTRDFLPLIHFPDFAMLSRRLLIIARLREFARDREASFPFCGSFPWRIQSGFERFVRKLESRRQIARSSEGTS